MPSTARTTSRQSTSRAPSPHPGSETIPLAAFIEHTREQLCTQTAGLLAPQYTAAQHTAAAQHLEALHGRPFLPAQIDAAAALALALRTKRTNFLVGEQGAGKTQTALGVAALLGAQRILALAPPHLIPVWEQEIRTVWPDTTVVQLRRRSDLERLPSQPTPLIALLSREEAKLGGQLVPAVITRHILRWELMEGIGFKRLRVPALSCPDCGHPIVTDEETGELLKHPDKAPAACPHCQARLWTMRHPKVHGGAAYCRVPLAQQLVRYHRDFFDLGIIDELHEYQGGTTWQGLAMGHVIQACQKSLAMTGTLYGGYSSSLFPILWRTHEGVREEFPHRATTKWITTYGLWDRITRPKPENTNATRPAQASTGPKFQTTVRERPGAAPELLLPLMDRTVFLRISDLKANLPPYREDVLPIEMAPDQQRTYAAYQGWILPKIKEALGQKNYKRMAVYTHSLLTWPDRCWVEEPAQYHTIYTAHGLPLPPVLAPGIRYPKERLLAELVHRERAEGRKVLIYASHTGTRDITARLAMTLQQSGIHVETLSAAVKPKDRLAWFHTHTPSVDAVICQPRLVATGMTLINFPTIVFTEPDFSTFVFRQASRRSWRIGQERDVRVYCLTYLRTAQEQAWGLIARKIKSALLLEGDLDQGGDGLATYQSEGEFLVELARQITAEGAGAKDSLKTLFAQCHALDTTVRTAPIAAPAHQPVPVGLGMSEPEPTVIPVEPWSSKGVQLALF